MKVLTEDAKRRMNAFLDKHSKLRPNYKAWHEDAVQGLLERDTPLTYHHICHDGGIVESMTFTRADLRDDENTKD